MLQFIIGTGGTGKTTRLFKDIVATVEQGDQAILLVPEQFSFECEKWLYRALGPTKSLQVEVLSFTRLCNNIFREYGGLAGLSVTPVAKYLFLSVAVSELQGQLISYQKSAQNIDFLSTLLQAIGEFKSAGLTPAEVEEAASKVAPGRLQDKLSDLAAIYGAYQGLIEQGFSDPDDDILRACQILENNNYFQDYSVFVDGFTTFMAGEFELLGHIIATAPKVTFALTTDKLQDTSGGVGLFSPVQQAATRLIRLAETAGVPFEEPVVLTTPVRYQTEAIAFLSKEYLRPNPKKYNQVPEGLQMLGASDRYEEVENTAVAITKLVQEEGYRYRDIAVVAREHSDYLRTMEMVFGDYEIPFFDDRKLEIETSPLVYGILAAVDAVRSRFQGEPMLSLAKSPIMGFSPAAVAQLENYHYVWQIRGEAWEHPFQNNPRGLIEKDQETEHDTVVLEEVNALRTALVTPLVKLREALSTGDGRTFAQGLYRFLIEIQAPENLTAYAEQLPELQRGRLLEESAQLWDSIIDVLDIFGEVLGGISLGQNRLCELFRLALTASEIGQIPQTLDQVLVGAANRIRPWEVKAVIVLGANEGIFPPALGSTGVFSDAERRQLVELGVEISPAGFQQSVLERFFSYFTLALPSHKLLISYAKADLQGREMLPSVIVTQLQEMFPLLEETTFTLEDRIATTRTALSVLSRQYSEDTPDTAALLQFFAEEYSAILRRMETAATNPVHQIMDTSLSKELFGRRMRLSPTRVERYHGCPFAYFAQDGLKIRKRQRAEFSPLESGSLLHHVLEVMVKRHGGKGLASLSLGQLTLESQEIITEYLENRVEDMEAMPTRFEYLFHRLCHSVAQLLLQLGEEFSQSEFEPVAFEVSIGQGEDKDVPPLEIESEHGIPVRVEGYIDRLDVMEKDGKKYIRVVDYKSGTKAFNLNEVLYGINLQMLLYLFTLEEYAKQQGEPVIPAGVLYMPVLERYITADREDSEESILAQREKRRAMSGLLLNDPVALQGMEKDLAGVYIPVRQRKDGGLYANSSVASLEEMGRLDMKIRQLIGEMADNLSEGQIQASPLDPAQFPTCDYCDYRSVCGYEEGHHIREIVRLDRQAVLELLAKQEENANLQNDVQDDVEKNTTPQEEAHEQTQLDK